MNVDQRVRFPRGTGVVKARNSGDVKVKWDDGTGTTWVRAAAGEVIG